MKIFLAAIAIVGFCLIGLCFNIIFRKNGKFPDGEISRNKELRKRGIICAKEEEIKLWGKNNNDKNSSRSCETGCSSCEGCFFNQSAKKE